MTTEILIPTLPERYYDKTHRGWCYPGWVFLHSIADAFPYNPTPDDRKWAEIFFTQALPRLLPCSIYSAHLTDEVAKNPIDTSTGVALSKWLTLIHNKVSLRLGQTELPYEQAQKEQEWNRSVNWSEIVKDLKSDCHKLCKFPDHPHLKSQCSTPEKGEEFRRLNIDPRSGEVGLSLKPHKGLLFLGALILLILLICAVGFWVLLYKYLYRKDYGSINHHGGSSYRRPKYQRRIDYI